MTDTIATESYAKVVLRDGKWSKSALPLEVTPFKFLSYRVGISRYVRVCAELDAVISSSGRQGNLYRVNVGLISLPTNFRFRETAINAALKEAKRQGIVK